MIERTLATKLREIAGKMPVVSVSGPRQSGKTTLVRQVFPDHVYQNLENLPTRRFALEDPKGFLAQGGDKGLIVDEAQYVPDLFSYIQVEVDETRRNGSFVLTGSQNFLLMEKISQSLAGRVAIFNLLPFSLNELKGSAHELKSPLEYIVKGSFPRVYDQEVPLDIFYPSYIMTYVERDVRQVQNVGDLNAFDLFLRLCAGHVGQLFNQSNIGNASGLTHPTVKRWLSILEASFIAFTLQPYHVNFNKRLVKTPKIYFYDTGLACSLLGIESATQLENHFAKGALFENFVILEIMKGLLNSGKRPNLFFWRDNSGNEIDLLVEHAARLFPFEIKSGRTLNEQFFNNLDFFNKISGNDPQLSYLVYGGDENQSRNRGNVRSWDKLPTF
jgi:hypothetical protein